MVIGCSLADRSFPSCFAVTAGEPMMRRSTASSRIAVSVAG
nr:MULTISPECIES: hypothetical protein [Streptomyces]